MILMPIVYAANVNTTVAFYERLGLKPRARSRSGLWTELDVDGAILAVHAAHAAPTATGDVRDPDVPHHAGEVDISFVATEPLEQLMERLVPAGVNPERGIADEAFGRSVILRDPDGRLVQINEHDEELYT
jgi:catechol 2,3-dioxygenase-like lactoylglutathione lyase family enzyme